MSKNVFQMIDEMIAGLQELKDALAPLSALAAAVVTPAPAPAPAPEPAPVAAEPAPAPKARKPRAARKAAPAVAVAEPAEEPAEPVVQAPPSMRALQGKYMAAVRVLQKDEQDRVRQVREQQGVEAAIEFAKSLKS